MPDWFLSSNSVTFALPEFETLKVTGPAGTEILAGEQPSSVNVIETVFVPGALAFDELPPQPAAATAIRTAATAATPVRLHDLDTLSPERTEWI
jgi:hypothetical protein